MTGAVIAEHETVDHLARILVRRVHGASARAGFGSERFAHGGIDHAADVIGNNAVKDRLRFTLKQGGAGTLFVICLRERKQRPINGDLREHRGKLGIDQDHGVDLPRAEGFANTLCQGKRITDTHIRNIFVNVRIDLCLAVAVIFDRLFADRQIDRVLSLRQFIGHTENIRVISSRESSVARHHDIQNPALLTGCAPDGIARLGGIPDLLDGFSENLMEKTRFFYSLLCAAKLGSSNELHGFRDLHGALHAFHARLDIIHRCACHKNPCLSHALTLYLKIYP